MSMVLLEAITGELAAILASLILLTATAILDRVRGRPAIVHMGKPGEPPGYTAHEKAGAAGDAPAGDARDPGYR